MRRLFDFAMDRVREIAPGDYTQVLPGEADEHLTATEQAVLRTYIGRFAEGLKKGLEAGIPLGINYSAEQQRQRNARHEAEQKALHQAIVAAEKTVESLHREDRPRHN